VVIQKDIYNYTYIFKDRGLAGFNVDLIGISWGITWKMTKSSSLMQSNWSCFSLMADDGW
jgi:hypothetical protein